MNSADHQSVCTHTHLLQRQHHLQNAQILPTILERVGVRTQGTPCRRENERIYRKLRKARSQLKTLIPQKERDRERGGWENRGRDLAGALENDATD